MKVGLVGPTYQMRSLPFDAQRTINMFPVFDQMGKEVSALYGTPGLVDFATAGTGPIREEFYSTNGRCFVLSGNEFYEIGSGGNATLRGTVSSFTGAATMDENPFQLALSDETSLYIFTYANNVFEKVTDVDLPSPVKAVTSIDGYFVVNIGGTGRFYISGINNGLAWSALDFATAESSPDELIRCINAVGQLWLFGERTTEIWSNTGASVFPFARISGAKMETGILALHTAVAIDNSVFWVGRDNIGSGIVYRAEGFSPQRISTDAIEFALQKATNPATLRAYVYQQEGHTFYIITGGGLQTSLVYDLATQQWHERSYMNEFGQYEPHLGDCLVYAFNKQLVGSRRDGKIYELRMDAYSDAGEELVRERIYTHLSEEGKRLRFNALELSMEVGVGLQSGQGSEPLISLCVSQDGGQTWSSWITRKIGRVGQYLTKVVFNRLGIAEQMTLRIRISDPVKVALTGSYLR